MKFVSLHHHSTYSYMDGFAQPEAHVARAAELGMSAMALTEHGNVSSHVPLEKAANSHGIKPIFGLEAYTAPRDMRETKNARKWHMTVLAMNDEGYRNLLRIVTRSWAEGFYRWPTVTGEMLADHNEGLIVTSGCADSKLSCDLLGGKGRERGDIRDARKTVAAFKELFGDRYYIEVQQFPELERTKKLNKQFEEFSREFDVPLVATADVHYPMPNDNEMQVILHAAGRGTGTVAAAEAEWEYDIRLTLPESDRAIYDRLRGTGLSKVATEAAIMSTVEIAGRCNVALPKVDRLRYKGEDGTPAKELIWTWLRNGWTYRSRENPRLNLHKAEYVERLKYEMDLVERKDFVDYFLMLSDCVRYAKDNGIPVGPARGSAAASLACYLLRITEIDPLIFPNMLFERFIDLNRTDLPDVDLDFDDERRDEVRQYLVKRYGEDHVGNIGTYTKYKGKNSLGDVARVFSIPDYEIKTVKDLMLERSSGDARAESSLQDTMEMFSQAAEVFERHPQLLKALRLEGNLRGWSTHAAGIVVANGPLTDCVATYSKETGTGKNKRRRDILSVDKYNAEYLGLLKIDALGLSTMGMIRHALEMIGMSLEDMYRVANPSLREDPEVIAAFNRGDVTGIFQFGGGATRIVNNDVAPDNFLELCDINALSRPGPLHSGATQDYIDIKHKRKKADHLHPVVDDITSFSKYQIIYQEQILRIVREIGGFDWTHAQEIRKIISLKHGEAAFNMKYEIFENGARKLHGIKPEAAKKIWRRIATAGTYAFNVAHCVSYGMLAYWTMWLKVNHPQAFYAASLRKDEENQFYLLRDGIKHGVEVKPPDVNHSGVTWGIHPDGYILGGYTQVPGIGDAKAEDIIADREENGDYEGWSDLVRVKGIGPKTVEMICGMAEGEDPFGIYKIDSSLEAIRECINDGSLGPLPKPTYKGSEIPTGSKDVPVTYIGVPLMRDLRDMIEDERARTGEDIEVIKKRIKYPNKIKKMYIRAIDDTDVLVFLRFSRFVFPRYEKALLSMNLGTDVMLVKGTKRGGFGTSIYVEKLWVIDPEG